MSEGEGDVTVGDWSGGCCIAGFEGGGRSTSEGMWTDSRSEGMRTHSRPESLLGQETSPRNLFYLSCTDADRLQHLKKARTQTLLWSFQKGTQPQHCDGSPMSSTLDSLKAAIGNEYAQLPLLCSEKNRTIYSPGGL